jgi:hypothetical protein
VIAATIPGVRISTALLGLALAQPVTAQTTDPLASRPIAMSVAPVALDESGRGDETLAAWIEEYQAWQAWNAKWGNRRQWVLHPFPYPFWKETPDVFSYVAPRRVEPAPPPWLDEVCARQSGPAVDPGLRAEGCKLLLIWKEDYVTHQIRMATVASRTQRDEPRRTRFLEHLHFASLWTNLEVGGNRAYGLAGVHATIDVRGRWQIYALPGVMAVSLPSLEGSRRVTIGYDWGMAFRLFSGRVPYIDLPVKVHLNLAQVWLPEINQKISMTGLSFSANRGR